MFNAKQAITKGVAVTSITKYSGLAINLVISAILARLLTPEEFGVVAISMVIITFFNLFGDLGIAPAIVQNKDLTIKDLNSIFFFTICVALVLSYLFYLLAPFISNFYDSVVLLNICQLLSISLFFNIVRMVPQALICRDLKFKLLGVFTIFIQIISGVSGILLAYNGFSYFSLVYKSIIVSVLTFFSLYYIYPLKIDVIRKSAMLKISSFSLYQFLFNFVNYFSRNLDNILIGKYLSKSDLGFYEKSYYLMMLPVQNLTHVLTPVMHPVLSRYQNNSLYIYGKYLLISKLLALVGFPLSILLYYWSNLIIIFVYGDQWINSIPVFEILALSVGFQIVLSSSGAIFQAINRPDLLFKSGLVSSFIMTMAISIGVFYFQDIYLIGICLFIAFLFNFVQTFYILMKFGLKQPFLPFIVNFRDSIIMSLFLYFILYFVHLYFIGFIFFVLTFTFFAISILILIYLDDYIKKNVIQVFHKIKFRKF